jgi:glycosyltransferase involved in cell wall biosynthesis
VRLIFVNRFYWPDEPATAQLLTDLAERLAERGFEVTVIASHPGKDSVPRNEVHRGVSIIRVGSSRSTGRGVAAKALDFATFHFTAVWRLFFEASRGDSIVAMTDPPLLGVGAAFVSVLRRTRLIHWAQDIYPELAIELSGQSWLRVFRPLRNWAWRRAEACVTLGGDMAGVIAAAGVAREKLSIIPNWAPAGLRPLPSGATDSLRKEWKLTGKFVVAYSGNLGRVHDLEPVLDLAEAMLGDSHITFLFVGSGAQRAALHANATRRRLTNIQFRAPQPRARLGESLATGDVHLVTVRPGCERYVFPSKLYGIAAVGIPVIFIGPRDCELTRIVSAGGFGRTFERSEISALASTLRELAVEPATCEQFSERAIRFALENGGPTRAAERWADLVGGAQACGKPAESVT